mmetsp:Transcript_70410/g.159285  ORF Transcript_70410/g.159285 Transcript_70410/m.159285 type:complete len:201 (-) Transcript_70410:25-627(-)
MLPEALAALRSTCRSNHLRAGPMSGKRPPSSVPLAKSPSSLLLAGGMSSKAARRSRTAFMPSSMSLSLPTLLLSILSASKMRALESGCSSARCLDPSADTCSRSRSRSGTLPLNFLRINASSSDHSPQSSDTASNRALISAGLRRGAVTHSLRRRRPIELVVRSKNLASEPRSSPSVFTKISRLDTAAASNTMREPTGAA